MPFSDADLKALTPGTKRMVVGAGNSLFVVVESVGKGGVCERDQVRFKNERVATGRSSGASRRSGGQTYRGGRIDTLRNYNPSKRGHFRGFNYPDGSYADFD